MHTTPLRIDLIRCDGGTQMRVEVSDDVAISYAERMAAGDTFPTVTVFHDGNSLWLADGFHRIAARRRLMLADQERWITIDADLRAGTREDAVRFAIAANRSNGLRRTNADKQIAVRAALSHPAMREMSDECIADEVGVARVTVRNARQQVVNLTTCNQPTDSNEESPVTRKGKDGKSYRPSRPESTSPPKRKRPAKAASSTPSGVSQPENHPCPMCKGKGYLHG